MASMVPAFSRCHSSSRLGSQSHTLLTTAKYFASEPSANKSPCFFRIRKKQGDLFADGSEAKYFAVVSNVWDWEPKRLLEWHREKAGTIEAIHDVLKNELAAGVLPCGRFGANAAWLRLAVLTHNLITALKRMALPEQYLTARPKRLRFLIFNTARRILHHARRTLCRIADVGWRDWLRLMPMPASG